MAESRRREFDVGLELVTPPASRNAYSVKTGAYRAAEGGREYAFDAYLPEPAPDRPPPVVVLVHGDAPSGFLREPRRWGQYRSWGALLAANGMAAIAFDHGSSEGRTRIPTVVAEIRALLAAVERDAERRRIDASRICVWSGSAGVPFGIAAALDHPAVRCQVAFYGPMDLRTDDTRTDPEAPPADLVEFSPITTLERRGGGIQPLLIAKAGLDRPGINDSIDAFMAKAEALGAPVRLETHADGRHAFDILDDDDRSREIIKASVDFMVSHLG